MSKVLLLNGVNLCMLGKGHGKFATDYKLRDVESTVVAAARLKGVDVVSKSTNSESVMIDTIHVAKSSGISCILINASSHAYTSFALVDALSSVDLDYVDIQLFREEQDSLLTENAKASVIGGGLGGYKRALAKLLR